MSDTPDTSPATGNTTTTDGATAPTPTRTAEPADLAAVERDLAGVETALERLDDGSYWTDEVTGEPIPDEVLAADPIARRAT